MDKTGDLIHVTCDDIIGGFPMGKKKIGIFLSSLFNTQAQVSYLVCRDVAHVLNSPVYGGGFQMTGIGYTTNRNQFYIHVHIHSI